MNWEEKISDRAKIIKPSGIRKFFDLASQMEGVISLGVGEPDFTTPWSIREAAIYSIEKGRTFYIDISVFSTNVRERILLENQML